MDLPTHGRCPREELIPVKRTRELRSGSSLKRRVSLPKAVEVLAEARELVAYDLPPELIGSLWGGRFRGQAAILVSHAVPGR